ncbi:hypothetical protein DCCM_2343 [Desulfocucumis palustris]|uniref:Uncharacterized protein n=1 Tax=Desulfocucumis palustris TaxID=1898651 RepID=A0A2L2XB83_9FIRM|nr:hypothetical protein DCCM_2343 [Desulfocucumis palustris]
MEIYHNKILYTDRKFIVPEILHIISQFVHITFNFSGINRKL